MWQIHLTGLLTGAQMCTGLFTDTYAWVYWSIEIYDCVHCTADIYTSVHCYVNICTCVYWSCTDICDWNIHMYALPWWLIHMCTLVCWWIHMHTLLLCCNCHCYCSTHVYYTCLVIHCVLHSHSYICEREVSTLNSLPTALKEGSLKLHNGLMHCKMGICTMPPTAHFKRVVSTFTEASPTEEVESTLLSPLWEGSLHLHNYIRHTSTSPCFFFTFHHAWSYVTI